MSSVDKCIIFLRINIKLFVQESEIYGGTINVIAVYIITVLIRTGTKFVFIIIY